MGTISVEKLQSCLASLKPGLAGSDVVELASCVTFQGDYLSTFNNEVAVRCLFQSEITGAVQAKEFMGFVMKLSPLSIITMAETSSEDRSLLILLMKRGQTGFLLRKTKLAIMQEIPTPETWVKLPKDFHQLLQFAKLAAGSRSSYPILNSILWNEQGLWSCDNFRIMHCPISDEFAIKTPILMPVGSVQDLSEDMDHYAISPGWVHFRSKDAQVTQSCRLMDGRYPDISKMIRMEKEIGRVTLPMKMAAALERVSIFSDSQQEAETTFSMKDGSLTLVTRGINGWSKERYKIDSKLCLSFTINPTILHDAMLLGNEIVVGATALLIQNKQFVHVISLK